MRIGVVGFINLIFKIIMSAHFNELQKCSVFEKFKGIKCEPLDENHKQESTTTKDQLLGVIVPLPDSL